MIYITYNSFSIDHTCVLGCSVVSVSLQLHGLAHQAPLSMGFSRQEYWSGLPFLPPGDLPDPQGQTPGLLHWQVGSLPLSHMGGPSIGLLYTI